MSINNKNALLCKYCMEYYNSEKKLTLLSSQVGHISHCLYSFTETRFIC